MTDEARPVWQSIGSRHIPRAQIFSQSSPRFLFRRVLPGDPGNVKQDRLAPFLNGEAAEAFGIDVRRTQELCGYAQRVQVVRILAEAKGHANFFVVNSRQVRRQCWIEVPPVVIRTALNGDFEQPIGDPFASATELYDAA
jgi:hypothetical protein